MFYKNMRKVIKMNKKMICIAIISIFLLTSLTVVSAGRIKTAVSGGNTIYVDDDNTDGPWYGTREHPYKNIQDGVDVANDGDTVYVYSGTYTSNVKIRKSINLIGENMWTTILDIKDYSNTYFRDGIAIHADYINIEGFTITNVEDDAIGWREFGPGGFGKGHHCTIQNCYLHSNDNGIRCFVDGLDDTTVSNCIIENCSLGIEIGAQTGFSTGDLSNWIIKDCTIKHSTGGYYSNGIVVCGKSSNVIISNCDVYDVNIGILLYSGQWSI